MIRIPRQSGKDSFELCPEKANRLHDDRAYVTCMCSYALQTERRKNITAKRKPKVDKSLVQKLQKYYMLQNILITRLMIIMRQ